MKFVYNESLSSSLTLLSDSFNSLIDKYALTVTQNERIHFLNNGFFFSPIEVESTNSIAELNTAYANISTIDNKIYLTSDILNHYFESKYLEIRASLSKEILLEQDFVYKKSIKEINIPNETEIIIEDDMENYLYIKNHLEYVSEDFSEFNNLREDIVSIIDYLKGQTDTRERIVNIIRNLPDIEITDDKKFVYSVSNTEDSIIISPSIISSEDIPTIDNENFQKDYDVPPVFQPNGSIRIPVIMYHQIANAPEGSSSFKQGLYTSPELFEEQIAYLTKKNYKSLSSAEFFEILKTGVNPKQKSIMLTFDDSVANHYTTAFPILKKYGQTGVFFVVSNRSSIYANQLKEMADNGMDIQSHSSTHPDLSKVNDSNVLVTEISGSKYAIQSMTGKPVLSIAYPGCVGNTQTFNVVGSSGYSLGFSCGKTIDHYLGNRLSLSRVHIPKDMDGLKRILSGIY